MKQSTSGGCGFLSLLLIAFIVLKLTKVINWSWWWVLSPIWISAILVFGCIAIHIAIDKHKEKEFRKWLKNKNKNKEGV